ncbi:uncharacterized protein LOC135159573 [Lytechinus pictus]|uniref:uncharacterized protein LOC135159573 n=1 Tax=Lytechinus pictus TaxID=7653 RepID=UPI0030BA02EC
MRRWPRIRLVRPAALSMSRAKCSQEEVVDSYFKKLEATLKKYSLEMRPDLIYNVHESGFNAEHKPVKVVGCRSFRHHPQAITSPRSALTTLIACGNAAGDSLPPFLIFKGKRVNSDLRKGALPGTKFEMSDSGWSNSDIFLTYMKTHFLPFVDERRKAEEHVLLICDGHKSHITPDVIDFAREKNIVIFILPAHTSHFLQPLDVGLFSPMKSAYNAACSRFMRDHVGLVITGYNICELVCQAHRMAMTVSNLKSSFRATGIIPFSPQVTKKDICSCSDLVTSTKNNNNAASDARNATTAEYLRETSVKQPEKKLQVSTIWSGCNGDFGVLEGPGCKQATSDIFDTN